jgi:hypothetical protein
MYPVQEGSAVAFTRQQVDVMLRHPLVDVVA